MSTSMRPIIGQWYKDMATEECFRVVADDEENDSIEVQYTNGDISGLDYNSWLDAGYEEIESPEDWSAPFDDVENDDLGYSDPDTHGPMYHDITLNDLLNEDDNL